MWIKDNKVFKSHSEVRAYLEGLDSPVSLPAIITDEMLAEQGFAILQSIASGHDPMVQVATELHPVLIEGVWTQQWEIVDLSPEQVAANLGAAIAAKNAEINRWRLDANFSTFTYGGKQIACDTLSRSDIDATTGYVALFGQFKPDWPGGWKTVDNSYVPITTVAEWKAFYDAFYSTGNANFLRAQTLKQQLGHATTQAEIEAIKWQQPESEE